VELKLFHGSAIPTGSYQAGKVFFAQTCFRSSQSAEKALKGAPHAPDIHTKINHP
jgi:hypothetical protein